MSTLVKSTLLSLSLVAGAAIAAHAQSSSVAALPPGAAVAPPAATAPVGPSAALPGPNPGGGFYGGTVQAQGAVVPSPAWSGPNPGQGFYGTPSGFQKPADWDTNASLHPYTTPGTGPRAN